MPSSDQRNSSGSSREIGTAGHTNYIALKDVYKLLKKEVETPTLQAMELDTFQKIATALGNLRGQVYEDVEAKIRDHMVDLLANSAQLLINARQHKINVGNEPLDYSKLTDEEKYILDGKRDSDNRVFEVIVAAIKGRPKVLESISARVRARQVIVRFLRPMEQFIGVDMNKYGPFQPEDVATLPFENARSMIESGIAVEVHVK
jgi:DNA replication factor GINS